MGRYGSPATLRDHSADASDDADVGEGDDVGLQGWVVGDDADLDGVGAGNALQAFPFFGFVVQHEHPGLAHSLNVDGVKLAGLAHSDAVEQRQQRDPEAATSGALRTFLGIATFIVLAPRIQGGGEDCRKRLQGDRTALGAC